MKLGAVDYASSTPPEAYECTKCGARGCKLWREYQTLADQTELLCCDCAGRSQGKDVSDIDADGRIPLGSEFGTDARTDQIGARVPAVPTEKGNTFWGYTSVPAGGVTWWRRLPNRTWLADAQRKFAERQRAILRSLNAAERRLLRARFADKPDLIAALDVLDQEHVSTPDGAPQSEGRRLPPRSSSDGGGT